MFKKMILTGFAAYAVTSMAWAGSYLPPDQFKEPDKQFQFVQRAIQQSDPAWAEYKLGHYYEIGYGTKSDLMQAYVWYKMSSINSFQPAIEALKTLKARMSAAQIEQGEKLAKIKQNELVEATLKDVHSYNSRHEGF